jgi:hypothetical protein
MRGFQFRPPLSVAALTAAALGALALAGCASGPSYDATPAAPPPQVNAPPPPNMNVGDLVGRWGYASFTREADRARTEVAARGQCSKPYDIGRGPSGGVLMHLADASQLHELVFKAGSDGKVYLGPPGPAPDDQDREVVAFDGRTLVLRWLNREVASRYGNSVYVRCGAPGTAGKRKTS